LCDISGGSSHAVAKPSPPPAPAEAVIERLQGLLVMSRLKG
jgi:hypothetical protein